MPNLAVVDMEGKNVGTIELAESVFGIEPNAAVMHQMVVNYLAAQRQGTQSALTRSEVSGGGKKPSSCLISSFCLPFLDGYALHYRYKIDENLLDKAAQAYVGRHDFTSFCTLDNREKGDMTRNVKAFSVTREGDLVTMKVEADGFLYNMVRIMVGTLLRIQQGKIAPDEIPSIIEKKNRKYSGPTAQACGLYLNRVNYENDNSSQKGVNADV